MTVDLEHLRGELGSWTCRRCGLCCACSSFVGPLVKERIPTSLLLFLDRATHVIRVIPVRQPAGAIHAGHYLLRCPALEGVVGDHVSCSVYEERFGICQDFEPGGEKCRRVVAGFLYREDLLHFKKALLDQQPFRSMWTGGV